MEELGATKLTQLSALSKSSEQLDQLWRHSTGIEEPDREKRSVSYFAEVREAQGQERGKKKSFVSEHEMEPVSQKNTQGQTQNQTQKKSLMKQNSEPEHNATLGTRNSSRSTSPTSCSSTRARVRSASPGSHGLVIDEFKTSRPSSETSSNPPSPRGLEISKKEIKSTLSTPTQTKLLCENRPSFR